MPAHAPEPPPGAAAPPAAQQHRMRPVLVAEDNATNQIVVRGLLEHAGYEDISVVEDGQQAVDAVGQRSYALILMDCRMPVLDGFEATARLRAAGCRTPIVALTANGSAADRERCLRSGMDDCLSKPLDGTRLAETVARWIGAAATQADAEAEPPPQAFSDADLTGHEAFGRQRALDRMDGDEQLFALVLDSFRKDAPFVVDRLRSTLEAGQAIELRRHLHSLTGSSAMVGAEALHIAAGRLEMRAADGDLATVAHGLPAFARLLGDFMAASAPDTMAGG